MGQYLIRRGLMGLVTLFGITLITFSVVQLAPGDPAEMQVLGIADQNVSERVYEQLKAYYGLDKPLFVQYLLWLERLVTGDFGNSFADSQAVSRKILEALWPTLSVAVLALFLSFGFSLPIGIYSAARQGGPFDRIASTCLYMLYSVPSYVMAMLLILFLGVKFDLLPFRGMRSDNFAELSAIEQLWDGAKHYVMITFCVAYGGIAFDSRFVRQNLLEVIRQDYIRTARAKGLSEPRVILKHAFVNTLIPFITLLGLTFPFILSGSVIIEYMFNWPGIGRLFYESVLNRDYPTLMALNFITAVMVLGITLLADLAYGVVDPRVKYD